MKFSQRSLNSLKGVHPDLVKVMEEAIKDSPIDFTITDGVRTTEQQKAEYAKGRTTVGNNPTKARPLGSTVTQRDGVRVKSNHQAKADGYGHAVDLYPFYDGSVRVNEKDVVSKLKTISNHIKATAKRLGIKITWGGDWTRPFDPPHFELA